MARRSETKLACRVDKSQKTQRDISSVLLAAALVLATATLSTFTQSRCDILRARKLSSLSYMHNNYAALSFH